MKKVIPTKKNSTINIDHEALMRGKRLSTKAKLDWLQSALYFGKLKRFKYERRGRRSSKSSDMLCVVFAVFLLHIWTVGSLYGCDSSKFTFMWKIGI